MRIENNFELTQYNSYKLKAFCKRVFFPECPDDFISIYRDFPDSQKVLLGGGYNVILSKDYYEEDFILIGESYSKSEFHENGILEVESGADLRKVSEQAQINGFTGLEVFCDIPSSLGGAIVMNAGASGEEIKDVLEKVVYLDLSDFKIKEIHVSDIGFEYRNSFFQRNTSKIVLKAFLKLEKKDPDLIREKMLKVKEARWKKQPREFPNAGSVFKRPKGYFVGTMVESLGLKGYGVGGAKVSEKHAGFIVNYNDATGEDIIRLIHYIQDRVREQYQVDLEIEQRII